MRVVLKPDNEQKFLNDTAYLELSGDEIDFCLGSTLTEAGKICRQIAAKINVGSLRKAGCQLGV